MQDFDLTYLGLHSVIQSTYYIYKALSNTEQKLLISVLDYTSERFNRTTF